MEFMPGSFVSNVNTDEWSPDPEVPGTEMHELINDGTVYAGLTRIASVDGPIDWTPEQREIIHVLEGAVRIEFADGSAIELKPGDIASFAAGTVMRWHVTAPFKELWVLA